jgi:heme-degrading monooxygenase HmoA
MSTTNPAFARTPEPPYYAVIFTNQRTPGDQGYGDMADRMVALAAQQPGFLGVESVRDAQGFGITVSYWATLDDIAAWKNNLEHQGAQQAGRAAWYAGFELRVARVERASGMHPAVIEPPAAQAGAESPATDL